jgi:hypothetical protein
MNTQLRAMLHTIAPKFTSIGSRVLPRPPYQLPIASMPTTAPADSSRITMYSASRSRTVSVYPSRPSAGPTPKVPNAESTAVAAAIPSPYHAYRRAPAASPAPASCDAKLCTMNTMPIGRMKMFSVFEAPVVVAATASSPSGAIITASVKPITACDARESTIGHASRNKTP